jgi:hypothetical protein
MVTRGAGIAQARRYGTDSRVIEIISKFAVKERDFLSANLFL